MKRILFAGSRQGADAEKKLKPVLSQWAAAWCLVPADAVLQLALVDADKAAPGDWHYHAAGGDIALGMASGSWRDAVLGPAAEVLPDDEVAEHLLAAARRALLQEVAVALGISGEVRAGAAAALPFPAQRIVLAATINQVLLHLVVDAALLAQEKAAASAVALSRRQEALSEAVVDLRIELPLMEVAVEDFLGLKPGDIISGQSPLGDAFRVSLGGNLLPLKASLGAQGTHKAIKLGA